MLKRAHHIGLCVIDIDTCISFWKDILGLKQTADFNMKEEFLDFVQGKEDMDYRIVKFETPEGFMIELLQDRGHVVKPQIENSLQAAGLRHFALEVTNVDEFYDKFLKRGYKTISAPATSKDKSMKLFFVRDPEENLIEIMQFQF